MNEPKALPENCIVRMDGVLHESKDFVAFLAKEDGDLSLYYSTDTLTIGMAMKLIVSAYVRCLRECTFEERREIVEILGEAYSLERISDG